MFTYQIAPGSTDVSVTLRVIDSADGTPETTVDHATSGIDLKYRRTGSAAVDITEAALAALTTAHTDGGVEQIGAGYIRVDLPDAACASGAAECLVYGNITDMVVIGCVIQLEGHVNKVYSDTTIVTSKTTQIYSDTTIIYSDTTISTSKTTQIYSDTTIIYSDTTIATSKTTQIYSDTTAIHTQTTAVNSDTVLLTAPRDGTAGAYPELGIIDQGTAQSATATTLVIRAAAAFADDTANGALLLALGSTQGYWQARTVTDTDLATDTLTVDTWTVTPSGTITYKLFGVGPATGTALSAGQDSKVTRINSKVTQIYSDSTAVHSDTTAIHTQTTTASSKAVQIYSDTTIIYSDTTIATSKTTQIYSDTTRIHSDTTVIEAGGGSLTAPQASQLVRVNSKSTQIYSDTTAIAAAGGSLSVAQDSKLTRVNSKATQLYSDTTHIDSDTTHIESDTARCESKAVQVYSDTTIVTSKTTQIYSDTTAIHTQTTTASSKTVQIYSDTTIAVSKSTQVYSDTTRVHSDTTVLEAGVNATQMAGVTILGDGTSGNKWRGS